MIKKNTDLSGKALICITTCNRSQWVKRLAPTYIDFWKKNADRYQFLLAIDGKDEETIAWAKENDIPYMYAEERKGVSMSKNRVIQNFWGYGYYFFIDDDVELIDGQVFDEHIEAFKSTGIHHFNLGDDKRFYYRKKIVQNNGLQLTTSYIGSGAFTFYTADSILISGYFHPVFGEYKRYGHTEHSFRVFRNRLSPAPFVKIDRLLPFIEYNEPESVTLHDSSTMDAPFGIARVEKNLIDEQHYFINLEKYLSVKTNQKISLSRINTYQRFVTLAKVFNLWNAFGVYFNRRLDWARAIRRSFFGNDIPGESYNF